MKKEEIHKELSSEINKLSFHDRLELLTSLLAERISTIDNQIERIPVIDKVVYELLSKLLSPELALVHVGNIGSAILENNPALIGLFVESEKQVDKNARERSAIA